MVQQVVLHTRPLGQRHDLFGKSPGRLCYIPHVEWTCINTSGTLGGHLEDTNRYVSDCEYATKPYHGTLRLTMPSIGHGVCIPEEEAGGYRPPRFFHWRSRSQAQACCQVITAEANRAARLQEQWTSNRVMSVISEACIPRRNLVSDCRGNRHTAQYHKSIHYLSTCNTVR